MDGGWCLVFGGMKTRGDHDGWIHALPLPLLAGPSPRHLDPSGIKARHPRCKRATGICQILKSDGRDNLQRVVKRTIFHLPRSTRWVWGLNKLKEPYRVRFRIQVGHDMGLS